MTDEVSVAEPQAKANPATKSNTSNASKAATKRQASAKSKGTELLREDAGSVHVSNAATGQALTVTNIPKFSMISDKAAVLKFIDTTMDTYEQNGFDLHKAAIVGIVHAAKHGDPIAVNRMFLRLRKNDQAAFRLFVRRVSIIIGLKQLHSDLTIDDPIPSEVREAAVKAGMFMNTKSGEWVVIPQTSDQRKAGIDLMQHRFLNPDMKHDKLVFDKDNFVEVRQLGDEDVLRQIIRLNTSVTNETDTRHVVVSNKLKKLLSGWAETASQMLGVPSADKA